VAFIVEDSFLVGSEQGWDVVKRFIIDVINRLNVNTDQRIRDDDFTRISLVIHSSRNQPGTAQVVFNLNRYSYRAAIVNQGVEPVRWNNGQDALAAAISRTATEVFDLESFDGAESRNGDRRNVENVAILLLWNRPNLRDPTLQRALQDLRRDVPQYFIPVGMGGSVDEATLREMAQVGSPFGIAGQIFYAVSPQDLRNYVEPVASYLCQSSGFSGVNECLDRQVHQCEQLCIDTYDSFYCACRDGYRLEGSAGFCSQRYCHRTCDGIICWCYDTSPVRSINSTRCVDVNECEIRNGGCEGRCDNFQGSYSCSCDQGLRLGRNNHECEDINECINNPCGGSNCVNTWGGYYCMQGGFGQAAALAGGGGAVAMSSVPFAQSAAGSAVIGVITILNIVIVVAVAAHFIRKHRRKQRRRQAKSADGGSEYSYESESSKHRLFSGGFVNNGFTSVNGKLAAEGSSDADPNFSFRAAPSSSSSE